MKTNKDNKVYSSEELSAFDSNGGLKESVNRRISKAIEPAGKRMAKEMAFNNPPFIGVDLAGDKDHTSFVALKDGDIVTFKGGKFELKEVEI